MKPKKKPLLFLIIIAIFAMALIGNKSASAQTNYTAKTINNEIIYSMLTPEYSRQLITDVLVDYMFLKASVAEGNFADAKLTLVTMIKVIDDYRQYLNPKYLKDSKKFYGDLAKLKEKAKSSTKLEQIKTYFSTLTNYYIEYVKSYGLYNKSIYLFQCDNNPAYGNGYWLSDVKADKLNPYAGKNLGADCIKIKETWTFN